MAITFRCPNGHTLQVKDEHAGYKLKCPRCKVSMTVPIKHAGVHTETTLPAVGSANNGSHGGSEPRARSGSRGASNHDRSRLPGRRGEKRKREQSDEYLTSAAITELPGEKEKKKRSRFASPFTASYYDYMDGRHRRGKYDGMSRTEYFVALLVASMLSMLIGVFAVHMESTAMMILFSLASACVNLWLASERCVNLGLEAWWCLILLIPCLGAIFSIVLLIGPEGYADHRKMDRDGYILAVVYVFAGPALVLFVAAAVMAMGA